MNIIHNSPQVQNSPQVNVSKNVLINSDVLKFEQKNQTRTVRKNGWICNLSQHYAFTQVHHEYLQIQANERFSQFTLICRLLEADTCRVIYFDDQLSAEQLLELRRRQQGSRTELLHAKITFMFSAEISTLYA
jgi:hypothetical protein